MPTMISITSLLHAIALVTIGSLPTNVVAEPIPFEARAAAPTVDLGYSVYQGTFDAASGVNSFKGYACLSRWHFFSVWASADRLFVESDMLHHHLGTCVGRPPLLPLQTGHHQLPQPLIHHIAHRQVLRLKPLPSMALFLDLETRIACF